MVRANAPKGRFDTRAVSAAARQLTLVSGPLAHGAWHKPGRSTRHRGCRRFIPMQAPNASPLVTLGIGSLSVALLLTWPVLLARSISSRNDLPLEREHRDVALPGSRVIGKWLVPAFTIGIWAWAGAWFALASSGALVGSLGRPPGLALLPVGLLVGTSAVARSEIGKRLASTPLAWLIGLQSFRLPLELVMHAAAEEGVMPPQMSFGLVHGSWGYNYDIVTGGTALLLALVGSFRSLPTTLVLAWNILGSVLLLAIMGIAISSLPAFAAFGSAPERLNTWVLHPPFIWLPTVLVGSALLGHLLIFRALARR